MSELDAYKSMAKQRNSNLELYRIIVMLLIVAHHYVVNSGLMDIMWEDPFSGKSLFLYWFGMWGKTGINCFVLITGYFMCQSHITVRKFLKLLLQIEFYKIIIYAIFVMSGYEEFSLKGLFKLFPVTSVSSGFISCFLLFYLCIPFLNILISNLTKRQHQLLLALSLFIYTVLGSTPKLHVEMNYVSWFCILYFIASYIRLYGLFPQFSYQTWGKFSLVSVAFSMTSVLVCLWVGHNVLNISNLCYYFVSDSNKILAVVTAVCTFMYFKDLPMSYSPFINAVGASTFGVLLIHANSDTMRQWLWRDTFDNVGWYATEYLVWHAVLSVFLIFFVCATIDYGRSRWLERPLFRRMDVSLEKYHWQ